VDPGYVVAHLAEDRRHWWFRGRRAVLRAVLPGVLPVQPARLLELGCGSGNMLEMLEEFGEAVGVEANPDLVAAARAVGLDARRGTLPGALPVPSEWADVVLLLDVLEHLDDEAAALAAARGALTPGGVLVITVPAYAWLWSGHDMALGHRRRYTAARLRATVAGAGFRVTRVTYFSTLLFPMLALARAAKRLRGDASHDLRPVGRALGIVLERCFAFERHLVPRMRLPFGSSLLLLARR
jgi:SAM-dependent methyltransferase